MRHHRLAAVLALSAALVSLLPLFSTWQSFESQRNAYTRISLEIGLWTALLGIVLGGVGGMVGLSAAPEVDDPYSASFGPGRHDLERSGSSRSIF